MAHVLVEATYDPPLTEEDIQAAIGVPDPECFKLRNIAWIRTYVSRDGRLTLCEFEAPDADSVREAFQMIGRPFNRVWVARVLEP